MKWSRSQILELFLFASCPVYTISSKYYLYFARLQKFFGSFFLPFTVIAPVSIPTSFSHTLPSCPLDTPQMGTLQSTLQIFLAESHSKHASLRGAPSSQNTRPIMAICAPSRTSSLSRLSRICTPATFCHRLLFFFPYKAIQRGRNCVPGGCTDTLLR